MESGFGQNLEGFLIKGNLSLASSELPLLQGDGSIEAAGTLYIKDVREYNVNNGITIQDVLFKNNQLYVPYVQPSIDATTASFVIDGGVSINHTANSTCTTSGGALTIAGGASVKKDLNIGGILNVNNNRIIHVSWPIDGPDAANKDYVDSVASKLSGNFTTGQVIIASSTGTAIRGYDSFTFDGSLLSINAPVHIFNTLNSTNLSTGSLVINGGVSIQKDVFIGGILDLGNNVITNIGYPVSNTDAATKQYVDDHKLQGNFTTGQLIVAASIGDEIRGYPNLTYDGITITLSSTENISGSIGGSFVCYGGVSIHKGAFIGGTLDLGNNKIINVAEPTNSQDAATKYYVDSKTYGNILGSFGHKQVLIGTTDPNSLTGFSNFTYDGSSLLLESTTNTFNLTSGGSFTTYGGVNIYKNLFVGGTIDAGLNNIVNVAYPINSSDAATKQYVDDNRLQGNFTQGQIIIAETNGDAIQGFNNLTFQTNGTLGTLLLNANTLLSIVNTTNATGLGSGGSLTSLGGASFDKNVYIGGQLDVNLQNIKNVAIPIEDYDAVNKIYVDNVINSINENIYGNSYTLNNSTTDDVPNLFYSSQVKAFVSNIYVKKNDVITAVFTLYGSNCGNHWTFHSTFVGDPTNVTFKIREDAGAAIIQYVNYNVAGVTSIKFKTAVQIDSLSSSVQTNYSLSPNVSTLQDITSSALEFPNSIFHALKLIVHVSSTIDNKCSLYILNTVRTQNGWELNSYAIGSVTGITFNMRDTGSSGILQYTNANSTSDYTIRVKQVKIINSNTEIVLPANTLTFTTVPSVSLQFPSTDNQFQLTVYVSVPTLNKHALYEIVGLVADNNWKINARYIGDNTGITFGIESISIFGRLTFTNVNAHDAIIKVVKSAAMLFEPLGVIKGGTGTNFLTPYAVLRGDGTNPILATDDFIYKDQTLILGNESGILLNNTTAATNATTGGTFTTLGGASFAKNVYIGGELDMQLQNIKQVQDPVEDYDAVNKKYVDTEISYIDLTSNVNDHRIEHTLSLSNNILLGEDIPNLSFDSSVKAFITNIHIEFNGQNCALYTIHGINAGNNWNISSIFTGHQIGVNFDIRVDNGNGIMQYTNSNTSGVVYIRYKTVIQVETNAVSSSQLNYNLTNVNSPENINALTFNNSELDSVKLIIYVSSELDQKYGLVLANCVLKGNVWYMNSHSIGNISGIKFSMLSTGTTGVVQYTNTNVSNDYVIRVKKYEIETSQTEIILNSNIDTPTIINNEELFFLNSDNYFQISVFVYVPAINKYALFEIRSVYCNNVWTSNSRYIGDYTGIKFFVASTSQHGKLAYTNSNSTTAVIKFIKNAPLASLKPLAVNKGGTSTSYLAPYAVLRGNGINPIIGTNDFIYKDNQLILGNLSSIVLENTQSTIHSSNGNAFVVYGGISINKDVNIGETLIVNNNDITPNQKDIHAEKSFMAANNQSIPQDVVGFEFGTSTKSFSGMVCVTITTHGDTYDSLYEVKGLKKSSGWIIDSKYIGDDVGINFSIASSGQIKYTSNNMTNWISTSMKFRALTTTI
jgi:hypothetical protein